MNHRRRTFFAVVSCLFLLFGVDAHAQTPQKVDVLVKTEVLDGFTVYPSRFVEVRVPWMNRIVFDGLDVPAEWVGKGYRYELWNAENRPIEGAKILDSARLPLDILNLKNVTTFRLVLFVPPGVTHPAITDLAPAVITTHYTEYRDNRLLAFLGAVGLASLILVGATVRRRASLRFRESFSTVLHTPARSVDAAPLPWLSYLWMIILCSSLFGLAVGSFTGGIQILFVLVKLPLLLFGTLAISFATVVILTNVLGGAMSTSAILRLALHVMSVLSIVLASVMVILVHFAVTDLAHDPFLVLTLVLVGLATLAGMSVLFRTLAQRLKRGKALLVSAVWFAVFAVMGLQLGWMMRPWVGLIDDLSGTVPFVRLYSGNVFEALSRTLFF